MNKFINICFICLLSCVCFGAGTMKLLFTWNYNPPYENVTSYLLYGHPLTGTTNFLEIADMGNTNSFLLQNVVTNKSLVFYIVAVNPYGASSPSSLAYVTTNGHPSKVTIVNVDIK